MPSVPPLDPRFVPAAFFNREYRERARASGRSVPLVLALERENGLVSRYETEVLPDDPATGRYAERLAKFLLWARGGWRLRVGGPAFLGDALRKAYSPGGERAFDADLMSRVYERPFEVLSERADAAPSSREGASAAGGHLGGCRLGFDLGASDFKVAAVREGEVVYSDEFPWDPRNQSDPEYHWNHLQRGLRAAADKLPRVDAIGGSSAGVVVANRVMVASLFRAVPQDRFPEARDLFLRLAGEWKVPVSVANDGDVTALAGAMALGSNAILGIAMGSSEAAGYLDGDGRILGWLNELAFAPVDYREDAAPDEWSGDRGVGALYFSQQAVNRLLPVASIALPDGMGLPERLRAVQDLMQAGDGRASAIYETIGVYLGHALAHYAEFYDFRKVLILGRVTTGAGGAVILDRATRLLAGEYADLADRIEVRLPDEKSRRVGQAVAAASLPRIEE